MDSTHSTPMMRTSDVQAIIRMVGGAAELWYEPTLQRQFTLDSLRGMLDASAGVCFTLGDALLGGMTPCSQIATVGLDETGQMLFEEYLRCVRPHDPVMDVLQTIPGRVVTLCRRDAIADTDWKKSDHFKRLRKPLNLGPTLYLRISAQSIGRETIVMILRETAAEAFTPRDAYLADLCLSEMAWPFTPDMNYTDPAIERLQPRLKKVMKLLLEGDSEKQVAYKLKLSPHTIHEYVKDLYAELRVSSRGELLAQFVGKV